MHAHDLRAISIKQILHHRHQLNQHQHLMVQSLSNAKPYVESLLPQRKRKKVEFSTMVKQPSSSDVPWRPSDISSLQLLSRQTTPLRVALFMQTFVNGVQRPGTCDGIGCGTSPTKRFVYIGRKEVPMMQITLRSIIRRTIMARCVPDTFFRDTISVTRYIRFTSV